MTEAEKILAKFEFDDGLSVSAVARIKLIITALLTDRERLIAEAEKTLFALQCTIINHNGKVPGLTDQEVFDGAISARDAFKQALVQSNETIKEILGNHE